MAYIPIGDVINHLQFTIFEILNLPESTGLHVETVSSSTTAMTLRVKVSTNPERSYFIKTLKPGGNTGPHLKLGLREVRFYTLIDALSLETYPNIPKCVNRFISRNENNYYLVLQDLTDTHQAHETVDFTDIGNWKIALSALAKFHKRFTKRLTTKQIQTYADSPKDVDPYINKLESAFSKFKTDQSNLVGETVLNLMASLIPLIREIEKEKADRVLNNELTTILHRDAHLKNFLYPRSADDDAVLVDWQFWGLGIGTFDLRHLLGSALKDNLQPYHQELVLFYYEKFIDGLEVDYSWSDCWLDYRKGIIDNLLMPVWQYTGFGWDVVRWGKTLETAIQNYYALDCDQIVL